eukprot:scaffold159162_cov35-Attheya_sp.AAC.2
MQQLHSYFPMQWMPQNKQEQSTDVIHINDWCFSKLRVPIWLHMTIKLKFERKTKGHEWTTPAGEEREITTLTAYTRLV